MLHGATAFLSRFAQACEPGKGGDILGFPTWYKYLEGETTLAGGRCTPIFNFPDDIGAILLALFEIILRVGALIAIGFVIYAGFQLMLAQGEPDRIKGARSTIINALIGLVITLLATAIVNLISGTILPS